MNELYDHRSLADGGGASFRRARASVAQPRTRRARLSRPGRHCRLQLPVRMKPFSSRSTVLRRAIRCTAARLERGIGRRRRSLSVLSVSPLRALPTSPCSSAISVPSRTATPAPLELGDQIVRHRLTQVRSAVKQGHERAATRRARPQPARRSCHRPTMATREPRTPPASGGPAAGEDAQPFEVGKAVDRQPPIFAPGREQDGASRDLLALFDPDDMLARFPARADRTVRGRGPRAELARLSDRPACELDSADPCRKAEVVLDPRDESRLATERPCSRQPACEPRRPLDAGCRGRPARRPRRPDRPLPAVRARARSRALERPLRGPPRASLRRRAAVRSGKLDRIQLGDHPRLPASSHAPGRASGHGEPVVSSELDQRPASPRTNAARRSRVRALDLLQRLPPRDERL